MDARQSHMMQLTQCRVSLILILGWGFSLTIIGLWSSCTPNEGGGSRLRTFQERRFIRPEGAGQKPEAENTCMRRLRSRLDVWGSAT